MRVLIKLCYINEEIKQCLINALTLHFNQSRLPHDS